MKITAVNEYRVEVELGAAEMERFGLSFESMDWNDIETRRALWSLVSALKSEGVNLSLSGRLLIEAGKLPDGVRLCFTGLPGGRTPGLRIKKELTVPVLRCESLRDARRAEKCLPNGACTLYTYRGAALLLIEGAYTAAELARAGEFGSIIRVEMGREILEEFARKIRE